jgi:probable HAF family extracellular repeat protein
MTKTLRIDYKKTINAVAAAIALLAPAIAFSAPTFVAQALPLPGTNSLAHGIGNDGTIVGYYRETQYRGFTSTGGTTTTYPTMGFGGGYNKFIDVNNVGIATGRSLRADYSFHAFTFSGGGLVDIGTLGGANSFGEDINDAGQVVGLSDTANGQSHAFSYQNGTMQDLGTLGGSTSNAFGVNNLGVIVGDAQTSGNAAQHAFVYQNGVMTDLGSLGGTSSATAINDNGMIVGNAQVGGHSHAAIFSSGTVMDLGTLGGASAQVYDVNNLGWIVGSSLTSAGQLHAFLYSNQFGMLDLNDLLAGTGSDFQSLNQAWGVNDYGQIVGTGVDSNGINTAFSLTVSQVPVPAAGWLFISSLMGLGWMKKKKRIGK